MSSKQVLVIGYYGSGNAGDEAVLGTMLAGLRRRIPEVAFTVPGERHGELERRHGVTSFLRSDTARLLSAVEAADLVVIGGGGLLHDYVRQDTSTLLAPGHWGLTYYCGVAWLAAELGRPVMLYAVGAGPLLHAESRDLVWSAARGAQAITVRDVESAELLRSLGVLSPRIEVTADPVWRLTAAPAADADALLAAAGARGSSILGVAVRNWDLTTPQETWTAAVASGVAAFARRHSLEIVFVPFQETEWALGDDVRVARELASRVGVPAHVLPAATPSGLAAVLGRCRLVLGMRLHSLIMACSAGVPAVALAYDPKVANLARLLPGMPCLDVASLTADAVETALTDAWDRRDALSAAGRTLAAEQAAAAERNDELAVDLLERPPALQRRPEARRILDYLAVERTVKPWPIPVTAPAVALDAQEPTPRRDARPVVRIIASDFFNQHGTDMFFGGAERYLLELSRVVRRLGYRPEVYQSASGDGWVRHYRDLRVVGLPTGGDRTAIAAAVAAHTAGEPAAATIYLAFYLAGGDAAGNAIGISHGIYWDDPCYQGEGSEAHLERIWASIKRLQTLVSVDANTINWVRARDARLAARAVLIPNFVDLSEFHPMPRRDDGKIVVLYPRRLYYPRGFWSLAEAAPALLEAHGELELNFVGKADPPEEEAVRRLEARYPGRVRWYVLPPERMAEAYHAADIVVIPTVASEGTSLSCLEAQACGKAVIVTPVGGLPDLVVDGDNGLVVDPGPAALANAITRLLNDPELRRALGDNAARAAHAFSIQRWRRRWAGVLRTFVPARPGARRWAARPEIVAVAADPGPALRTGLWELASRTARLGMDVYWLGVAGGPVAPRLHVVAAEDELYLERPMLLLTPDTAELAERFPDGEAITLARAEAVEDVLRRVIRPALVARVAAPRPLLDESCSEGEVSLTGVSTAGELGRAAARPDEVTCALATVEETAARLRRELAEEQVSSRLAVSERSRRIADLQGELDRAQAYATALQAQITSIEGALSDSQAFAQDLQGQVFATQGALIDSQEFAQTLQDALNDSQGLVEQLQTQLVAATELAAEQAAETQRLGAALDAATGHLAELEDAVVQRSREVEDWRAAHDNARTALEYYRGELFRWQSSRLWRFAGVYWEWRLKLSRSSLVVATWRLAKKLRHPFGRPSAADRATQAANTGSSGPSPQPLASLPELPPRSAAAPEPPEPPKRLPDSFPALPSGHYDIVVFSIIDWDFRFQRPQQIATQFARSGHRVLFLSTTQWLPPDGPGWELTEKASSICELKIRSPRALDVYGGKLKNGELDALEASFTELAADLGMTDVVGMVQIPFWTPVALRMSEKLGWHVVYDCMDEWTNFPGFGADVLRLETDLVKKADVTVVSADRLVVKHRDIAPRLVLARNGVDLVHYERLYGPNTLLGDVAHPVIGYYGALASWVDVPLLEKIADAHPTATIVLAGGHFDVNLSSIISRPNVRLLGQRPYYEMPQLLWNFDACVIPFLVNDITEATNPVKFYEYCFGGKPVVAPRLTELLPFEDISYLAEGHEQFLAFIDKALQEKDDDPRRERRRQVARDNDWRERKKAIDLAVQESWPRISVVIVTYGGLELTRECLASLLGKETWPNLEVIVVDNASPDDTLAYLESVAAADSRVIVIANGSNLGFAAANNIGLTRASGEILVLLNNDTVVPPGLLARMAAHLRRDKKIGLLCPTTNFVGNEAKVEPGYTDLAELPAAAAARWAAHAGKVFDIHVAAMYCVAMRRDAFARVGKLDEAYGVGMFEDDDYAVRMRREGLRVVCAEDAYVHHVGQGAFAKLSPADYNALWKRNQAYYEKKFGVVWKAHKARAGTAQAESRVGKSST